MQKRLFKSICFIMIIISISLLNYFNLFADGNNLVLNSGFEDISKDDANYWTIWQYKDEKEYSSMKFDKTQKLSGEKSLRIENFKNNDARLEQSVKVEPNSYYKLSCWVKTENVSNQSDTIGANISLQDLAVKSNDVKGTSDWTYVELIGKTGPKQSMIRVSVALGGNGGVTTGVAWFDDVAVEKVDQTSIASYTYFYNKDSGAFGEGNNFKDLYKVLGVAFCLIILLSIFFFLVRKKSTHKREKILAFMSKKDFVIMFILTFIYFIIAIYRLGDLNVPKTQWKPNQLDDGCVINFKREVDLARVNYYCALGQGRFRIEGYNKDTNKFEYVTSLSKVDNYYVWKVAIANYKTTKVKLVSDSIGGILNEIAFFEKGSKSPIKIDSSNIEEVKFEDKDIYKIKNLFDEQNLVSYKHTFMQEMYFDEVYHARTAFEHLNKLEFYENTHPPLGKVLIMFGIYIFGMSPFGWRIVGTMIGVLMIPLIYLFAKKIFNKTYFAFIAAFLMTFDFMHFVQTRIATIDVYGTFFTIIMYYFMYDVLNKKSYKVGFYNSIKPLFFAGLFFGIGSASKWICVYAGGGLALIYIIAKITEINDFLKAKNRLKFLNDKMINIEKSDEVDESTKLYFEEFKNYELECKWIDKFWKKSVIYPTVLCLIFFILIPSIIYYLSYIPTMVIPGHTSDISKVVENQKYMYEYHKGCNDDHPFRSPAYSWPIIYRPMWYYEGPELPNSTVSSIVAMGNPAIWWMGLVCILTAVTIYLTNRDKKVLVILIGVLSQYMPWFFITRSIFIYHFFSTVPFLVLAISYCIMNIVDDYKDNNESIAFTYTKIGKYFTPSKISKNLVILYLVIVAVLFIMFYPILSGMEVDRGYVDNFLKWMNSWTLSS